MEAITIAILLPLIGYVIDPLDPFFIGYQFPWLIIAPLLVSLRYGFIYGAVTASLSIGIVSTGFYLEWSQVPVFPKEVIVGMVLVTMISTEFHELWNRKIKLLEDKYNHLKIRTDKFSYTYQLIKASHYQLEQHLVNQTKSLRLALIDLEKQIESLEKKNGEPLVGISEGILKVFCNYTNVRVAAIYAITEQQKIIPEPVAYLGRTITASSSDQLIEKALRNGCVASISIDTEDDVMTATEAIAVIPLIDVYRKIWGVVVVYEIPLFALQENTMDLFAVLGGKIGDLIKRRTEHHNNKDRKSFERKLSRIINEINQLNESAVVIAISVNSEALKNKLFTKFQNELRGADEMWVFGESGNRQFFLILLPYTSKAGASMFLNRTEVSSLQDGYGLDENVSNYNDDTRACMWILDNKTSREKVLLEIYQFGKKGFVDSKTIENKYASNSGSI